MRGKPAKAEPGDWPALGALEAEPHGGAGGKKDLCCFQKQPPQRTQGLLQLTVLGQGLEDRTRREARLSPQQTPHG